MPELKNCSTNYYDGLCGVNVVVDPQSVTMQEGDKVLIVGQMSDSATAPEGLYEVDDSTREELFGEDSMINRQISEFQALAKNAEIAVYVVPNTGTAGTATVQVSGVDTATASGSIYLYVNGKTYNVPFDPANDTNADVADKFQAMISDYDETLIATVSGDTVTIETMIKGEIGGFLDVRDKYERRTDQKSSGEITLTISKTDATGFPNLTGLADLDNGYEFVASPYTDSDSLSNLSTYLCGQWSGGANSRDYTVAYGDFPTLSALAENTNNPLVSFIGINKALTPSYLETSSYSALMYNQLNSLSKNIAMSTGGKLMPAMLSPEFKDEFSKREKAELIASGMGYFDIKGNQVSIGRAVTSYTTTDNGQGDTSLQDVNQPALVAYMSHYFGEKLQEKYKNKAFRTDGVVGGNSNNIVTMPAVLNYLASLGQELSDKNIMQDVAGFINSLGLEVNEVGCLQVSAKPETVKIFCCLNVLLQPK